MHIDIFFFGRLADATGLGKTGLDTITSIEELKDVLTGKYPKLREERYRIAVNKKIVDDDHQLNDGDEVALLPPYAGG